MKLMPRPFSGPMSSLLSAFAADDWFRGLDEDGWFRRLPAALRTEAMPACNVAETEKEVTVTLDLPGLDEKDIKVELMGNRLTVSGDRKWEQEKKNGEYHRVEVQYGAFERAIALPEGLRTEPDAVQATYKNGVLEVRVPKREPTPAKRIAVKSS